MFGFLPPPIEDELLYGLLARHAALLGKQRSSTLSERLTGGRNTADLPNLSHCAAAGISSTWFGEPATLLRTMTAFPYYEHGMSTERALQTRAFLLHSPGGPRVGCSFRRRAVASLRWCPECAELDREQSHLGTWRVSHQLPEVYVCPTHGCALLDSRIRMRAQAQLLVPPTTTAGYEPVPCRYPQEVAFRLAQSSAWLLRHVPAEGWRARVPALLARAMAGRSWFVDGHLRKWPLAEAVLKRFGAGAFETPECFHLVKNISILRPELMQRGCINVSRLLLLLELCDLDARTFFVEGDAVDGTEVAGWSVQRHTKGHMPFSDRFMMDETLTLALPPAVMARLVTADMARKRTPEHEREHERWGSSEAKDRWWARAVKAAAMRIRARRYPERVCMKSIERRIAVTGELRYHMRSPLTKAATLAVLESREDYLLRRLEWLVTLLQSRGEEMTQFSFLKQVGRQLPPSVRKRAEEAYARLTPGGIRVECRSNQTLAALVEGPAASGPASRKTRPAS